MALPPQRGEDKTFCEFFCAILSQKPRILPSDVYDFSQIMPGAAPSPMTGVSADREVQFHQEHHIIGDRERARRDLQVGIAKGRVCGDPINVPTELIGEEVPPLFELAPIAPTLGQRFVKRPLTTAWIDAKLGRADRKMCNNPGSQRVCREHDVVPGRMCLGAIFAIIDLPYSATA